MAHPRNALATRLKLLRLAKGFTLREVEMRTGGSVSNSYLSQIENGLIASPSPAILDDLAGVYDADYYDLIDLAYPKKERGKTR